MKLLTKKKQEEILKLLSKIGSILLEDDEVSAKTYDKINKRSYDIAFEISGFKGTDFYFKSIQSTIKTVLAKMGE